MPALKQHALCFSGLVWVATASKQLMGPVVVSDDLGEVLNQGWQTLTR